MIKKANFNRTLLYTTLLLLGILMMVPFFWMIFGSMKTAKEIRMIPPTFFPQEWQPDNFIRLFSDKKLTIGIYYKNSIVIALSVVSFQLFTSSLAGYIFAKFNFPGKNFLFWFIMSTMIVPFQVTMVPGFLLLSKLGLINTLWGLILPAGVGAFGIFLMQQFAQGLPDSYMESARMEGASEFSIYLRLVLPISKPALATLGMMTFMWNWNSYLWPAIVLQSDKLRTLPIILYWYSLQNTQKLEMINTAGVVVVIPVLIIFLFAQKYIIRGLTMTGLKA